MKCDELKAYNGDVYIPVYGSIADADVYLKDKADEAIAELKEEVNNLLMQNGELCQALQVMYSAEEYTILQDENVQLKQKLENVQASMYCDVVDANMKIRRLKRALYKACANWARSERYTEATWHGDEHREELWAEVQEKCRAKAEEYK